MKQVIYYTAEVKVEDGDTVLVRRFGDKIDLTTEVQVEGTALVVLPGEYVEAGDTVLVKRSGDKINLLTCTHCISMRSPCRGSTLGIFTKEIPARCFYIDSCFKVVDIR